MVQAASKAIIRKAAPAFEGMAWYQQKFQKINLEQFRGKLWQVFSVESPV